MKFFISLRSELLKTKRTSILLLSALIAAIVPVMLLFEYCTEAPAALSLKGNPWNLYFSEGWGPFCIIFMPLYIILVCTLLPQIEYSNGTWKQVFTSPQYLGNVLLSKYLVVQLYILLFFIMYNAFMAITASVVGLFNPALQFGLYGLHWQHWLQSNSITYLCILGCSALQFWMGIRFKNFIAPIGTGVALLVVAGMMIFEFHLPGADKYPYAYPILSTLPKYQSAVPLFQLCSVAYAILFLLLILIDFKYNMAKGK